MRKHELFEHYTETFSLVGRGGNFRVEDAHDKAVITSFPSSAFNFIYLAQFDTRLISELINAGVPFACMPQGSAEKNFAHFCARQNLIKSDRIFAHEFAGLADFKYQPNPDFIIKKVASNNDLEQFDHISSAAFNHPEGMASQFLKPALRNRDIYLFLAHYEDRPVGCAMLSFVGQKAGLYWGGVLPEYRNLGVATALTEYRMNFAKSCKYSSVFAHNMPPSVSLYQRLGFKPVGALPMYVYKG